MLSRGLPVRHHVVVYMHARLSNPLTCSRLQPYLCLDTAEVSAATWVSRSMVEVIASLTDDGETGPVVVVDTRTQDGFPDTIK